MLRVCVTYLFSQAGTPEADHEAVLLAGREHDLSALNVNTSVEYGTEVLVDVRGKPAGTAVGDAPIRAYCAEIAPRYHIAGTHFYVEAQSLYNAAPEDILEWVIAEQGHVSRSTSGGYAWAYRVGHATDALGRDTVEIWPQRCLELGSSCLRVWQTADTVYDNKDYLRRCYLG